MAVSAKIGFFLRHLLVHTCYVVSRTLRRLLTAPVSITKWLFGYAASNERSIVIVANSNARSTAFFGLHSQLIYKGPLYNGHVHTILGNMRHVSQNGYQRERVKSLDGQTLNLDFLYPDTRRHRTVKGMLLVVPGLLNASSTSYVRHFAHAATERGFAVCVINYRGMGSTPLEVPRLFSATYTDDIRHCVNVHLQPSQVRERVRTAMGNGSAGAADVVPLIGVGFSLGGIVLIKYICEEGKNAAGKKPNPLHAVVAVTSPFDLVESDKQTDKRVYQVLYEKPFSIGLRKYVSHNRAVLENLPGIDSDKLFSGPRPLIKTINSIKAFDALINAPHNGFPDPLAYYAAANALPWLQHCRVPALCISALNDPVVGPPIPNKVWQQTVDANDKVVYARFPVGGHLGFLSGPLSEWRGEANEMEKFVLDAVTKASAASCS